MVVPGRAFFALCVGFWQVKDLGMVSVDSLPQRLVACIPAARVTGRVTRNRELPLQSRWEVPRKS